MSKVYLSLQRLCCQMYSKCENLHSKLDFFFFLFFLGIQYFREKSCLHYYTSVFRDVGHVKFKFRSFNDDPFFLLVRVSSLFFLLLGLIFRISIQVNVTEKGI